ncbi:MAG: (d)CMP kinase [Alphaproteobacteria bacterium]|nr:(d)CMP kinase [Alphaproteobacteria bacterium]
MIIAVDGPSAAGKGTLARGLAQHFGYHFLDTGALYRMVGLKMLRAGADFSEAVRAAQIAQELDVNEFEDADLRTEAVGAAASRVAVIPEVRSALLQFQREFAKREPGAVLDGRDIGTVICPHADFKFFVTASAKARSLRRFKELLGLGIPVTLEGVTADIIARDARDASRATAPTKAADDAIVVDTTLMTAAEALKFALAAIETSTK